MTDAVQNLIKEKGLSFNISGRDYLVHCLNPSHADGSPSMRIDKTSGMFHCFSCGFKGNIFKHYGLNTHSVSIRVAKLKEKIANIKTDFEGLPLPEGASPFNQVYRDTSKETYQYFDAFTTLLDEKFLDRICFPIKDIRGKTIVYQARHMHSNGNPRYVNLPAGIELPLYPVTYPGKPKSVVFVEGLFDMLNCFDKGLTNVTCCFGTNTLQKDTASKLLPLKAQGIQKVFLLFDGDEAGKTAAEKLKPLIEESEFEVEIIKLPEDMDPGNLNQEYVDSIKEYIQAI
jgi:DNA primase